MFRRFFSGKFQFCQHVFILGQFILSFSILYPKVVSWFAIGTIRVGCVSHSKRQHFASACSSLKICSRPLCSLAPNSIRTFSFFVWCQFYGHGFLIQFWILCHMAFAFWEVFSSRTIIFKPFQIYRIPVVDDAGGPKAGFFSKNVHGHLDEVDPNLL